MASPYCPSFAKSLRGNPSIGGILSALGVVAPGAGVAEPGARRPRAERGNLKAPEVTQLNYRLTTKLHKEKIYNAPRLPRRNAKPGSETLAISKRATVRWSLSRSMSRFRPIAKARELLASLPLPRPQDARRSAIATPSRAGLRTGA